VKTFTFTEDSLVDKVREPLL